MNARCSGAPLIAPHDFYDLLIEGGYTFAESARGIAPRAAHRFQT